MFDEAIEALTQMNESYKNLRKENTQMYFELSYLKLVGTTKTLASSFSK